MQGVHARKAAMTITITKTTRMATISTNESLWIEGYQWSLKQTLMEPMISNETNDVVTSSALPAVLNPKFMVPE